MPNMEQLIVLEIMDNVVAHYSRLGTCLLHDKYGNTIRKLEINYAFVERRIEEIFRLWMEGKDQTNLVSWLRLVECLRHIKLHRLADEIELEYCVEKEESSSRKYRREYDHDTKVGKEGVAGSCEEESKLAYERGQENSERESSVSDEADLRETEYGKRITGNGEIKYEKEYETQVSKGQEDRCELMEECSKEERGSGGEKFGEEYSEELRASNAEEYENEDGGESNKSFAAAAWSAAIYIATATVMYLTNCLGEGVLLLPYYYSMKQMIFLILLPN